MRANETVAVMMTPCQAADLFQCVDGSVATMNLIAGQFLRCIWSLEGALVKIHECSDVCLAGPTMRGMGYGIAAREPDGDWIFFAADTAQLIEFERAALGALQ